MPRALGLVWIVTAACGGGLETGAPIIRVTGSGGAQPDGRSFLPSLSGDGRVVGFVSAATNLVPGDANARRDVYVLDRGGAPARVGLAGDPSPSAPALSGDGRVVAFVSGGSDLVPFDTNGRDDVFVHDRDGGKVVRVSVSTAGMEADGASSWPRISAGGRVVAFVSLATNLVTADQNGRADVFLHDRDAKITQRVSVTSDGGEANGASDAPGISADGDFVTFTSEATNLVAGDANNAADVFLHDRETRRTVRVSVATGGGELNAASGHPAISADGRFVAFHSAATNGVERDGNGVSDVFVHDRLEGSTARVSVNGAGAEGNGASTFPQISADGRFVVFHSFASNLVAGDTNGVPDLFVHDRRTGKTARVNVSASGKQADEATGAFALSADGRYVAFNSEATNLVPGDTNGQEDVFVAPNPLFEGS